MIRLAALISLCVLGMEAQGLRFQQVCVAGRNAASIPNHAEILEELRPECDGEVLVGAEASLWRGRKKALLIQQLGEVRNLVAMDSDKKTWTSESLPSQEDLWAQFDSEESYFHEHKVNLKVRQLTSKKIRGHLARGFQIRWHSSRPARPFPIDPNPAVRPICGTARFLEEGTREIEIDIETWIDSSYAMPGAGWDRVAWGMPELLVKDFVALIAGRAEVRKVLEKHAGLAVETRIHLKLLGQEIDYVVQARDVKHTAIEAKEFAIPADFREEK